MAKILLLEEQFTETSEPDRIEQALLDMGHDVFSFATYNNLRTAWRVDSSQPREQGGCVLQDVDVVVASVYMPGKDAIHIPALRHNPAFDDAFAKTPIIAYELGDLWSAERVKALGADQFVQVCGAETFETAVIPLVRQHVPDVPGRTGSLTIYNPMRAPG
ncbi:MAG: hypothetical protein WAO98_03725 [Alphaproteobacteria bacterium]